MRKCQMCGYLVLGDGEICKNCGCLLSRMSALVTSGAPPPAPRAPALSSAPPLGFSPVERAPWDAPSPVSAKAARHNTPRAVLAFIAIASMVLGWVAVDRVFQHGQLPAGTKAFVAGHGIPFSSPDHTFDAEFPTQPRLIRKHFSVASVAATLNLAQAQTDDYEVVAASMVMPTRVPDSDVDAAIHQILDAGAASQNAEILAEKKVSIEGASGIEVRAKVKDGYDARLLVVVSGSRFYLLGVHSRSATKQMYDALVSSLIIY